jgi:Heterokaryon incompatibility protein Het-C
MDEILQCLFVPHPVSLLANVLLNKCRFHPEFQNHSSQIQREMLAGMRVWLQSLGYKQSEILTRLSKQAVRNHQNVRPGGEGNASVSQGTFASNPGSQAQGSAGMGLVQGLYSQFSGGAGGRREGNDFSAPGRGSGPVPGTVPPSIPISTRPGSGQAGNNYGDSPIPSSSQYVSPPPYPGGSSSGVPSLPQTHSPRPPPLHGPAYGYPSPTQPSFLVAPENPPYTLPGSNFPDPGLPSPHLGGPSPASPVSPYPGSSYPGQSPYPGQQEIGFSRMPGPNNSFNAPYNSPAPPFSVPGTVPSFPPGAPSFPNAQPEPDYGSAGYSGYGQGPYQPEY